MNSPTQRKIWPFQWRKHLQILWDAIKIRTEPLVDPWFSESSIACYQQAKANPAQHSLDDQTWHDLALTEYRSALSICSSIFAKQILHYRLRSGVEEEHSAETKSRIRLLIDDVSALAELQKIMAPLRRADTEIADLLFLRQPEALPSWLAYTLVLPYALIAAAIGVFFSLYGLFAVAGLIGIIATIQTNMQSRIGKWEYEAVSLQLLLGVITTLSKSADPKLRFLTSHFLALQNKSGAIHRSITRLQWPMVIPGAAEYADWFFISNIKHFRKCFRVVNTSRLFLRNCYEMVANLDADIAIAKHLISTRNFCWATRQASRNLVFNEMVHPLVSNAIPLSLSLNDKGLLITGQNGVGKSTLLKTIGINLVAGRAFGFCYARQATISTLPVYASFNNDDSLSEGESLYNAELRRTQELLLAAETSDGSICLIDEIFRGTNYLEAVAAASAVLHALTKKSIVIVSSHHVVLAPLLAKSLMPIFLDMNRGDFSTLKLRAGVLISTNGIALLNERGFAPSIESNAKNVLNWLNTYLAHPTHAPDILNS